MALNEEMTNDVIDIDLSDTHKKRFRIDGDNNRIVYLNTSDLGIINRLSKVYPKLQKLANEASFETLNDADNLSLLQSFSDKLTEIDGKMRGLINELFESEIDKACAPDGTMFDIFNGRFRFEIICEKLIKLYGDTIISEFEKISQRAKKYTDKYTQ